MEGSQGPTSPGADVDFLPPHVQEKKGSQEELGSGVGPGRPSEREKAIVTELACTIIQMRAFNSDKCISNIIQNPH
jgi:hypothetical protein